MSVRRHAAVGLFALTLFVSAGLLFAVQPLVAKRVLPRLGGTPAVWNTCLVFFQAVLLAGYTYADLAPRWLGLRRQALAHLGLLALAALALPPALPDWDPPDAWPVLWLLGLLAWAAGPPFFAVSTSAPLLQRWFTATGHPHARDPYFLYAASNLGSLLALLAYPFLIEPALPLDAQGRWWAAGYLLLVGLTAACAAVVWRSAPRAAGLIPADPKADPKAGVNPAAHPSRGRWLLLAFVPSSLLLSATTYLTTDIAAIPLLWVLPLALYLLTFILAFARWPILPHRALVRWMPLVVLVLVVVMLSEATEPVGVLLGLHLLGLFWIAMVCHGELARLRPPAERLTEFYLWLSLGGVLGGLFNALAAPLLFSSVAEYPLVLVLACFLLPAAPAPSRRARVLDVGLPAALGVATAAAVLGVQAAAVPAGPISVALMFAVPAVVCYTFHERPWRFGAGVAALLLAGGLYHGVHGGTEYRTRSFFGVHRVTIDPTGTFRQLVHGNTVHGMQFLDPERRREPLTYYHRTGPIGRLLTDLQDDPRLGRVGLIGLGAGALASYAQPGQHWTFFEIDPAVIYLARDSGLFTYCRDSAGRLDFVVGDARLTLGRTDDRFGMLVIDAFSSDAIPVHLLTREALRLYRDRLADDGILAFNISNRYLDLEPVLGNLAADADPPWVCRVWEDTAVADADQRAGKSPSRWVVMANRAEHLDRLGRRGLWTTARTRPELPAWNDDYSNLVGVFQWQSED